ncbi:MAG: hypothetical protein AAFY83_13245, partial [Pseudomonadota bacterium]
GKVEGNSFKIWRAIQYNNSFQPTIEGQFRADDQGTKLSADLKMNLATRIGNYIFLIGVGIIGATFLLVVLESNDDAATIRLAGASLITFIPLYLMFVRAAFRFGAAKTREVLAEDLMVSEIWQGHSLENAPMHL